MEKNWCSQNFDLSLKHLSIGQFLESSNSCRYHLILILLIVTWKSEVWKQNCLWLFYCFNFERNYDLLKSKSPCILLNKNIIVNNETVLKMENLIVLEGWTLCFSSYKNCKLKVKLWWIAALERKNRTVVVPFTLCEGNFKICIEYTFRINILLHIKKTLLHTLFCIFLKSLKAFSLSLKMLKLITH